VGARAKSGRWSTEALAGRHDSPYCGLDIAANIGTLSRFLTQNMIPVLGQTISHDHPMLKALVDT
jgi:hypothetical protein